MKAKNPFIRQQLIHIATEKFLENGYERTSMAQISATFGGSKTTLYTHFPKKEKIFLAVVEKLAREKVENAFSDLALEGMIRDALIGFGEKYLSVICSKEILSIFKMGIEERGRSQVGHLLYSFGPKICRKRISNFFNDKKNKGVIKECDTNVAAIHYIRLIESDITELFLLGIKGEPSEDEIKESVRLGVDVFLSAYLS
ncbi:MAG TPA: TetR/AcrR family transcriptional regulator [Alcaligenes sp.]|nr:TetR/AcrR family transcriptional regulator [Alcaligenes faecalis]HRL20278.1 TetR/AcrR family transcriptional regulator [Alcaligenes sp.]